MSGGKPPSPPTPSRAMPHSPTYSPQAGPAISFLDIRDMDAALVSCWMFKKSDVMGTWKKRYFWVQKGDLVYGDTMGAAVSGRLAAATAVLKMGEAINHKTLGALYTFTVGIPNTNDEWTLALPSIAERAVWSEAFQSLYATEPTEVQGNMRRVNISLNSSVGVEISSETHKEANNLFGSIAAHGLDSISIEELSEWIQSHPFFARGVDARTVALNVYSVCMTNPHSRLTRQSFINFFKYPFWITPDYKGRLSPVLLRDYKHSKGVMLSLLLAARPAPSDVPSISISDFLNSDEGSEEREERYQDRLTEMRMTRIVLPEELPPGVIPSFGSTVPVHSCSRMQCGIDTARSVRKLLCALSEELEHEVSYCSPLVDLLILVLDRDGEEFGGGGGDLSIHLKNNNPTSTEAAAFALVRRLIASTQSGSTLFLPLNSRDMEALALTFEMFVSVKIPHVYAAMYACGASAQNVFRRWMSRMFVGFFSRNTVYKVFDRFLADGGGVTVLFQAGLCALKLHSVLSGGLQFAKADDFAASLTGSMPFMGHMALRDDTTLVAPSSADVTLLMKYALSLGRDSINHSIKPDSYQHRVFRVPIVPPTVNSFVDQKDWLVLWSWLPITHHSKNPKLLFSTADHGYRLETLLAKCEDEPHYMIIKSIAPGGKPPADVFGVYVPSEWKNDSKQVGETFVFSLKPATERFLAVLTGGSELDSVHKQERKAPPPPPRDKKTLTEDPPKILMTVSPQMLALGSSQGFAALSLNHTLREGSCHPCPAFNNPYLAKHHVSGTVEVLGIECWGFLNDC